MKAATSTSAHVIAGKGVPGGGTGRRRCSAYRMMAAGLLLFLPVALGAAEPEPRVLPQPHVLLVPPNEKTAGAHMHFFPQLLELALEKTRDEYGPIKIRNYPQMLNSARALSKLRSGEVDVIWTMTDPQREQEFLPVRVSLLRGLAGHRVFLIRAEDRERFAQVQSLEDLRQFTAGAGDKWPDTDVLQANQLPVTTSSRYDLLFNMLASKRFHYLPRGLYEVWDEYEIHKQKGLVIEDTLMLYYEAPNYFFVNRKDPELAERIERGLQLAVEDGSFDELFLSVPSFRRGVQEMENPERRTFHLRRSPNN